MAEGIGLLAARFGLAAVFWQSGRTKVVPGTWLEVNQTARALFAGEYAQVPLPPDLAATAATWAEFWLPILLVLGLGARFAAAGILAMTVVIQIFVYPDAWRVHLTWCALAWLIVIRGAGLLSLDTLAARAWRSPRRPMPSTTPPPERIE